MVDFGTFPDHAVGLIFGFGLSRFHTSIQYMESAFSLPFNAANSSWYHSYSFESKCLAFLDAVKQAITSPLFWPEWIYCEIVARNVLLYSVDGNN